MSSKNSKRNNNNRKNNNSNMSMSKEFPQLAKMGNRVKNNFMRMTNNETFLYVMLILGITTVLGFMSVRNYNAVILFIVVAFAVRYFTKNIGVIMLVAVILSNIISVKSTIEGMRNEKGKKNDKKKDKKENVDTDEDSDDEDDVDMKNLMAKSGAKPSAKPGAKPSAKSGAKPGAKPSAKSGAKNSENMRSASSMNKQDAMNKLAKMMSSKDDEKKKDGMAPIDYKLGDDVDDDDMIDLEATQEAAYNNLNKFIGNDGFAKMSKDTERLINQQNNLAQAMQSIGPLIQNAEKMMQGLNLDKFGGMLDKLNGMMGKSNETHESH